jgi:lipopolysaccharide transport system ATP-binding protein
VSTAIRAEGLAKVYKIKVRQPDGSTRRIPKHALRDVAFEVSEGEVFGIIGRNGAGKSTLLKILSRITVPTRGRVTVYGRVASLLEVGTGMHPEMTGRENIFLNGALLGMAKTDIAKQFDKIVEFAGVAEYIDTPIKRYSSGMKLRLAFAVAAHLSADVMIVDEVLAVGDAEFQAKCLNVMRDGTRTGRTTLFVSHNMAAVENLCSRVMWLDQGVIVRTGKADAVVREYLGGAITNAGTTREFAPLSGDGHDPAVHFSRASVTGSDGNAPVQGDDLLISIELEVRNHVRGLQILVALSTLEGNPVCSISNGDYRGEWDLQPGHYQIRVQLSSVRLLPQTHRVSLRSVVNWGAEVFEDCPDALAFHVLGRDVLGSGISLLADRGVTWIPAEFQLSRLAKAS